MGQVFPFAVALGCLLVTSSAAAWPVDGQAVQYLSEGDLVCVQPGIAGAWEFRRVLSGRLQVLPDGQKVIDVRVVGDDFRGPLTGHRVVSVLGRTASCTFTQRGALAGW